MIKSITNKLRLIDYLAIFVLVCLLLIGLLWFTRTKEYVIVSVGTEFNKVYPPYYWLSNAVETGAISYNEFGAEVGEVLAVENIDYGGERRFLRVDLKLETIKDKRTGLYRYGNQRLRIGDTLSITLGDVLLEGIMYDIRSPQEYSASDRSEYYMTLKVMSQDVYTWLIPTYTPEFHIVDEKGQTQFQILEVVRVSPASPEIIQENNRFTTKDPEELRDVELIVKVRVSCSHEICYYNRNYPIRLGNGVWAHTKDSTLHYSVITEIVSKESAE